MPATSFIQALSDPTTLLQSPYLYLQAAGSDGSDGSVAGFHLRWTFHRTLGNTHLPKGFLSGPGGPYPAGYGFNKIKDFVSIYRGARVPPFPFTVDIATNVSTAPYLQLDFNVSVPILFVESGPTRYWQYNININNPLASSSVPDRFVLVNVRFTNVAEYDSLVNNPYNPHTSRYQFFSSYKSMIEVELVNELMCEGIFIFKQGPPPPASAEFKVEAVSVHPENFDDPDTYQYLSARKILRYNDITEQRTITAENIKYFRFKNSEIYARGIYLLSYYNVIYFNDVINNWVHIGDFALADDDQVAQFRLEPPNTFIHKRWPKYNDIGIPTANAFTVNVPNYVTKWNMLDGLKEALIQYLTLSQSPTNPTASDIISSDDAGDSSDAEVSYLDLLNLAATDFHVARMLGLGHIENGNTIPPHNPPRRVMYLMEYVTEVAIENIVPVQVTYHLYASLPTGKLDFRLPPVARLKPLTYGISLSETQSINGPATPATDEHGYSFFEDARIISLNKETFEYEKPLDQFFADQKEFVSGRESEAAAFGVEYKASAEPAFRAPEINNDPNYFDPAGKNETIPIPNSDAQPLFVHSETEEGKHTYGLYSINWFSRTSQVGNLVQTDITKFVKKNTLVPPINFAVQLIQDEQPRIFTTQNEQNALALMPGPDKTLVRVTFDLNHVHHHAYQLATHAEFFFRKDLPKVVRGKISQVFSEPNNRVRVTTESYELASASPAQTVQPNISPLPPGNENRFIGSSFAVEGKLFTVEDVTLPDASGDDPEFTLKKIRETNMFPVTDPPSITETFIAPEADKMFMVTENLNDPAQWDSLLTRKVFIEYFHTVLDGKITGATPQAYNKSYTVMRALYNGSSTEVTVRQEFPNSSPSSLGHFVYSKKLKVVGTLSSQVLKVTGNVTGELTLSTTITVIASQASDANYGITNLFYNPGNGATEITVNPSIASDDLQGLFYITFEKKIPISSLSSTDKKITLSSVYGDLAQELIPLYRETITESDGTETILNIGGLTDNCTIIEKEDVIDDGSGGPLLVPGSRTGVFEIQFQNLQLQPHITPGVEWYKGKVRIMEDVAFIPPPGNLDHTTPLMKELEVFEIDTSGPTLKLIVYDSTFEVDTSYSPIGDYVPIQTTAPVKINFHPSYRLYLEKDTANGNNFESASILPDQGDGSRQTLMAARSIDKYITPQYESNISVPVILLAMEIVNPEPPDEPLGPTFATRPDYYGKATYSFDVKLDTSNGRQPYAVIFYRANERMILDQLYQPATVSQILTDLANLQSPDADFSVDRWKGLVNGDIDTTNNLFKVYPSSGTYRFPIPDNNTYSVPNQNINASLDHPLDGVTPPGDASIHEKVKQAINGAFLSLTEIPAVLKYIPPDIDGTRQTSGRPPKIRDIDGRLLLPTDQGFDPFPMAVKYENSGKYIKFTDYTLDGASKNFYFYYAVEMSNKLKMSARSPISGPIFLINAAPAEEPGIKKVTSLLADVVTGTPTGVKFDINDYIESERIRKIEIFRTPDFFKSHSVRTMDLAKTVDIGNDIIDDFSDVPVPLFGKSLYYRLVALREIINEDSQLEYVPSRPSALVLSNVVDNFNPLAPVLSFTYSGTSAGPNTLHDVVLSWQPTCYNGKYYLYKMTSTGNWIKIFEIQSDSPISIPLIDTDLMNPDLVIEDDDSNTVYHRFRVEVENSSGLLNLQQNELTIPVP